MNSEKAAVKTIFLILSTAVLSAIIIGAGCSSRQDTDEIVAQVGRVTLTRQELSKRLEWEGMKPAQESEYVERWVNREILSQEARRLKLNDSERLDFEIELVKKEYLANRLLEKTFAEKVQISEDEINNYYTKNQELFRVSEDEIHALHILTDDRTSANLAYQSIVAGKDFETVARESSIGPFKEKGGDAGFFTAKDVIPEVWRHAVRTQAGALSPVFRSDHGYHLLKVVQKRNRGDLLTLNEARDDIIQRLRVSKERAIYYDLIFQLQNKMKVYVNMPSNTIGEQTEEENQ